MACPLYIFIRPRALASPRRTTAATSRGDPPLSPEQCSSLIADADLEAPEPTDTPVEKSPVVLQAPAVVQAPIRAALTMAWSRPRLVLLLGLVTFVLFVLVQMRAASFNEWTHALELVDWTSTRTKTFTMHAKVCPVETIPRTLCQHIVYLI